MKSSIKCRNMKSISATKLLCLMLMLFSSIGGIGQVTYRVGLDANKTTYRVYMKSAVGYSNIQAKISTAQVTLLVPHGVGANQFNPINVIGKIVGSNQMSWGLSRADAPPVNPLVDYISFGYSGSGSAVLFNMVAGEEIELFNFQNAGNCLGTVSLITDTDVFLPPNSENSNPGNQMTILGFGQNNAYVGNYGGGVNCQSTFPDLTVGITGSANITAGIATNYAILVNNIGTLASLGQIIVATTLPSGLTYNSFSGNGWSINAAVQGNGTTIVTATNNNSVAINGSLATLQLSVTAAASIGNGNSISIASIVSGGSDSNVTNNTSNTSSIVTVNAPNLLLGMSGPSTISPNGVANYSLNLSNIGSGASSGAISASILLPAGISYNNFSGSGWTYGSSTLQNGGAILLTFTNNNVIAAGGSANTLVVNVSASNNLTNNTILTISGNVSGGGDITPANNSASANTTVVVASSPNLGVNITGANNFVTGTSTNLTININNVGAAQTSGPITSITTLPAGVVYNSFSGNGWTVIATPQGNGTTLITSTYTGLIQAGVAASPLIFNITPQASLGNGNTIIINNVVSGGGNLTNVSTNFNAIISVPAPANLSLSIFGLTNITPNTSGNYTFNISNSSSTASSGLVTQTITLPAGISYNSFTGNGWTFVSSVPQGNGTTILTFTNNNVIAGNGIAVPLNLNLSFASNLNQNSTIIIGGNVSGGGSASNNGNINLIIAAVQKPDLTLSFNGTSTTPPNGTASYTINVNNVGNVATNGTISTSFLVPNGLTYTSFSGIGWTYGSSTLQNGGAILLNFTTNNIIAANGDNNNLILNFTAGNAPNGTIFTITGNVSGGGESNLTNNSSTINLTIVSQTKPELTVTIIGNPTVNVNATYNYIINVNNIGNAPTAGTSTVTTILPVGVTYNSTSGNGWTSIATPQPNGTTLVISTYTGIISINGSANSLILNVTPTGVFSAGSIFIINGTVSGGGSTNTGNNSFSTTSTVNSSTNTADLAVFVTINNSTPTVNQIVNYTFNIINNGTGNPTNVQNLIKLPPGFVITSINNTSGNFNQNTNIWNIGSIQNGQVFTLIISGKPTSEGIDFAKIEITNSTLQDNISKNNIAKVCYATPVNICAGEGYIAYLDKQNTNIKWYKNAILINGANADSLLITSVGNYSAVYTNICNEIITTPAIMITNNCPLLGSIGDYVWYDNNNNGKQDLGENGVPNVILELYKDGVPTGKTTTTDASGKYLFPNLISGNYQVKIKTTSLPALYTLSYKSNAVGVPDSLDSDFDHSTALSQIIVINTSISSQSINLTIDGGIKVKPESEISDPCHCFGAEYALDEKKELFEIVSVNGPANDVWKVIQQTGMLALDSLVKKPVLIGTPLIEVSSGKYELSFTHEDSVGYTVKVSNGEDTLSISNFCSIYPQVQATRLDQIICKNSPPIPLTATMNIPGKADFYYIDKLTNQKVIITSFDPKKFSSGETVYIKIDVVPASGTMCTFILVQTIQMSVIDCDETCKPKICVPVLIRKTK